MTQVVLDLEGGVLYFSMHHFLPHTELDILSDRLNQTLAETRESVFLVSLQDDTDVGTAVRATV